MLREQMEGLLGKKKNLSDTKVTSGTWLFWVQGFLP